MSAIISGLLAGAVASIICTVAERRRKPAGVDRFGSRSLQPGRLMIATIVGCSAMAALPAYILATGGSTRPDAETQNFFAMVLATGFFFAAGYTGWLAFAHDISWDDHVLRKRGISGPTTEHRLEDAVAITTGDWSGLHRITFKNGTTIHFASQLRGARELCCLITNLTISQRHNRRQS